MAFNNVEVNVSGAGITANKHRGASNERPTEGMLVGFEYFDTTLGKPIWWNGNDWVDATGTTV